MFFNDNEDLEYLSHYINSRIVDKSKSVNSLLGAAISLNKNLEIINYLISLGADINAEDELTSTTPLEMACYIGNLDIIHLLLQKGAKYHLNDFSLLFLALKGNNLAVLKFLINELGMNVNCMSQEEHETLIFAAISDNKIDFVKYLISSGSDINVTNKSGVTPLLLAIEKNNLNIVKLLLLCGVDINYENDEHYNALLHATSFGHFEIVKLLVKFGVDLDFKYYKHRTPINVAIFEHYNDIAKYFIDENIDICFDNNIYSSPFSAAIYSNNFEMIDYLIKNGRIFRVYKPFPNPISIACEFSSLEMVKFLVDYGFNINYIGKDGIPPLLIAVDNGKYSYVEYLLKSGADPNIQLLKWSPLSMACMKKYFDIAKLLIHYGANYKNLLPIVCSLEELDDNNIIAFIKLLIQLGADIDSKIYDSSKYFTNSFLQSILCLSPSIFKTMLGNRTNLNFSPKPGVSLSFALLNSLQINEQTPTNLRRFFQILKITEQERLPFYQSYLPLIFMCATNYSVFKYFVNKGINISASYKGKNILHKIASVGNLDVLKYALKFPLDIYKKDWKGRTPFDIAIEYGNFEVACYLEDFEQEIES